LPVLPLTFELSFDNFHTSTQVSPDLARWRLRRRSVRKLRHTLLAAQREARKSGANPDNRERHRQASGEGTDNRQGECGKQVYLGAQLLYRHGCLLHRAESQKAVTGTKR